MIIKEACIETLSQAITAEQNGATQLEVCSHLELGGLTPPDELIIEISKAVSIPIHIIVRPGDQSFVYDLRDIEKMIRTISFCKAHAIEGVVFGILNPDNELDLEAIAELTHFAFPLKVTIHKAIDETPDPVRSAANLTSIDGITEILTSGGMPTAVEGSETIKSMIEATRGEIRIKAAGKITCNNFQEIHDLINAEAYHGRKIVQGL